MATALLHYFFYISKKIVFSSLSLFFSLSLFPKQRFFHFHFFLLVVISLIPTLCSWCCTFVSRDHDNSYHTTAKLSIFSSKDRAESQPRILMVFFFFMPVERSSLKKDQILSLRKSKWLDGQLDVRCSNV